ncbi:RNA-binding S4 domain-containing protein [Aestuariirhabdus litorea]|uniref:Heat shock protein 15 n=1 Tax=Aestuariirhabdus litorea TaxID=2528527 RepID=A0A3P3VNQ6_9GAMM|nr:S4 domain-containing protein [Aestuariirhabdus litorea]RRJ82453.1 RNA-binding protein [Aestuariirhabdus litorea]RWW92615.1 RNA-binding protein [Endozoicomonadaceae bacterium GTF-13]
MPQADDSKPRLDKWLWAARFFKTRSLAKQAVEGGKVHYNGARTKPSKEPKVGDLLKIRQGLDDLEVEIVAISEQRRGAPEAQRLYRESDTSIKKREAAAAQRKALRGNSPATAGRPTKKQRRDIRHFHDQNH